MTVFSQRNNRNNDLRREEVSNAIKITIINLLPDDKILDWSKLKQFADDNFKFAENGRKFSKQVENTVDKGRKWQKVL